MTVESKIYNALNGKVEYKYVPEFDIEGTNIKALTIKGENIGDKKTKIFGYYGLPENTEGKVPAMVLIHGGGGHAFHCWVKQWNDRGYAAIAVDTTGFMPKSRNAGYKEGDGENWVRELSGIFFEDGYVCAPDNDGMNIEGKSLDEHWMLHAVCAAVKANSFLCEQEEIDTDKIGVTGVSWGGVITSILMGWDNRFAFAAPIYGSAYLGDSFSDIMQVFKNSEVEKYWLAEKQYDNLKMPVLWLAWNDDCCFSVQSNSKSYLHSLKNNKNSRISLVHLMNHSHNCAWRREETFCFADWCVGRGEMMPSITDNSFDNSISLEITADKDTVIEGASLYYITSPMEYKVYNKFGNDTRTFMAQQWQIMPLSLDGNKAKGIKPENAVGFYKEVIFIQNGKKMTVTTDYKEI